MPRGTRSIAGYRICLKLCDLGNNDVYTVDYVFADTYQVAKTEGALSTSATDDTDKSDIEIKLVNLQNLLDKGLISEEEYTEKRASIISAY